MIVCHVRLQTTAVTWYSLLGHILFVNISSRIFVFVIVIPFSTENMKLLDITATFSGIYQRKVNYKSHLNVKQSGLHISEPLS